MSACVPADVTKKASLFSRFGRLNILEKGEGSLIPQALDRVEFCGFARREHAEDEADHYGDAE
jgi:hypothetical protein